MKHSIEKFLFVYRMRKKIRRFFKDQGFFKTLGLAIRFVRYGRDGLFTKIPEQAYKDWMDDQETIPSQDEMVHAVKAWKYLPIISVVTPVYNVDPKWLDACIQSVLDQGYPHWELCLYDDASTNSETLQSLKQWELTDSRIKVIYGKENLHISKASNKALESATGEFVALLDNDDTFAPHALFEVVKKLQTNQGLDYIYTDEDKISEAGKRVDPFFKPDWSLHLFLSMMYVCHLSVFRRSLLNEIGGFRDGFEGSQDYDLVLRFIEKTESSRIVHIPHILYHWRMIPGSAAVEANAKPYAHVSAKKALQEYADRNNLDATVCTTDHLGLYRIKYNLKDHPLVSIIIPFRDQQKLLEQCVTSILSLTEYPRYEILLVNNQSGVSTRDYVKELIKKNKNIRVMHYNKPFNFADMNNLAVKEARGEQVIFLNNDTEITQPDWIENMLEYSQSSSVGAVGCKLLYPNGTIQHAGVVIGLGGIAAHPFMGRRIGIYGFSDIVREYSAVTGACMMVRKKTFQEVGGFDADHLGIAYNDVDLCLKLRQKGYLVIYTPFTQIIHHESMSRGNDNDEVLLNKDTVRKKRVEDERLFMATKWADLIKRDPYYNDNLAKNTIDYRV
jgi:GT2 family glycosyltransferase